MLHARCAQEQTCRVSGRRTVPAGECGARAEGVLLDLCVFWPPEVTVGAGCGVGLAVSLPIFCPTVHGLHTRGLAAWINPHPHPTHSTLSTCARALYIRFSSPLLWLGQKEKELVREEQKDHL